MKNRGRAFRMPKIYLMLLMTSLSISAISQTSIQDFRLENLEGESVAYSDLKGEQLTVIDFWATWCRPCQSSIPKLVDLHEKFENRGVQFIGISIDSPRNLSKVGPMARSLGIEYPVLLDVNSRVGAQFNVDAVPSLFIIDTQGHIVLQHRGFHPGDELVLEKEINELLKKAEEPGDDSK